MPEKTIHEGYDHYGDPWRLELFDQEQEINRASPIQLDLTEDHGAPASHAYSPAEALELAAALQCAAAAALRSPYA